MLYFYAYGIGRYEGRTRHNLMSPVKLSRLSYFNSHSSVHLSISSRLKVQYTSNGLQLVSRDPHLKTSSILRPQSFQESLNISHMHYNALRKGLYRLSLKVDFNSRRCISKNPRTFSHSKMMALFVILSQPESVIRNR